MLSAVWLRVQQCLFNTITVRLSPEVCGDRGEELLELIQKPTAKAAATVEKFRSAGGPVIREHCPKLTKEDCMRCAHPHPQFVDITGVGQLCERAGVVCGSRSHEGTFIAHGEASGN